MGRKKAGKQAAPKQPQQHEGEPVIRLVAASPCNGGVLAVAVGPSLRVWDCSAGKICHEEEVHAEPIRALCFSPDGKLLLTASDDKTARIASTSDWSCITAFAAPKKLCAATFSADGAYAIAADKFGDVLVASTRPGEQQPPPLATADAAAASGAPSGIAAATPAAASGAQQVMQKPSLLLGHLCSIITSLTATPDGHFLVSTDKESKVRVSIMPPQPLQGAWEIQSYCFGHTSYVTSSACLQSPDGQLLLLSAGGDGTVRVWAPEEGKQLAAFTAAEPRPRQQQEQPAAAEEQAEGGEQQQEGEGAGASDGGEQEGEEEAGGREGGGGGGAGEGCRLSAAPDCAAVLDVAASPDGCMVAVAVEGADEVQLLSWDAAAQQLALTQKLALPGVTAPCRMAFDAQQRLWVVGGPPVHSSKSLHLAVAAPSRVTAGGASGQYELVTEQLLPTEALAALERRDPDEEAAAAEVRYSAHLRKRTYDEEMLGRIKQRRSDRCETERLHALAAEQERQKAQQQEQQQGQEAGCEAS